MTQYPPHSPSYTVPLQGVVPAPADFEGGSSKDQESARAINTNVQSSRLTRADRMLSSWKLEKAISQARSNSRVRITSAKLQGTGTDCPKYKPQDLRASEVGDKMQDLMVAVGYICVL
jgi:hypothetical protein